MKRIVVVVVALAVVAAGCSSESGEPELVGIRASTDTAVGDERFLFAVAEIDGRRRGSPDEAITLVATSLDAPEVEISTDAEFVWIVPEAFGLYRADIPFDRAGLWEIDFDISTGEQASPFLVDVLAAPSTVAAGDPAPLISTPTSNDVPIADLTTDLEPMPSLYEMSLDDAFTNGQQSVVIFATPAFCTSASCGPLLQLTKDAADKFEDVNFVHVEVYSGFNEEGFQPDADHVVPAVEAFKLPSEPWIFVIDENGVVKSRLEGVLSEGELESVINS
ncbi:MAG: hypothetical protein ABFR53_05755 [Actinomycetota bacterium]